MKRLAVVVLTLGLSACAGKPQIVPDWTTYPRGQITEVSQRVSLIPVASLPPTIGTMEYRTTKVEDDAEVEVYLLPRNPSEGTEERLLSRVHENGRKQCKHDYRVVEMHYFYGTEATLKFLRIQTPALRVRYRCSLALSISEENHPAKALERISRALSEAAFFDISTKHYRISRKMLFEIVREVAVQEGIPIIQEGREGPHDFLIAGRDPDEERWGRIERLVAVVSDASDGSVLTFRLFAYQLTYHKRGVQKTRMPAVLLNAQPWDRKTAYVRAMRFLSAVDAAIARAR